MRNKYAVGAHVSEADFRTRLRLWAADVPALGAAKIARVNKNTMHRLYTLLRRRVALLAETEAKPLQLGTASASLIRAAASATAMKAFLRASAVIVGLVAVGWWLAAGANRGWTKNSVAVVQVDEVTGLESRQYERRFVPGVDFLAVLLALDGVAGAVSCFVRSTAPKTRAL
jgi:hypothetical protein